MKYYIVDKEDQLTLFKVANDLVTGFEREYKNKAIASGGSIMETLQAFELINDPEKERKLEAKPEKYKGVV